MGELVRLRVKDIDLSRKQVIIRAGKGDKDRVTLLPDKLADPLAKQLLKTRALYGQDRRDKLPRVMLEGALKRKMPRLTAGDG